MRRVSFKAARALVCAAAFSTGSARAANFVNDTWLDADRSDPASPIHSEFGVDADADGNLESAWYVGGTASTLGPSAGHLVMTPGPSGSASWTTHFAPEATPISLVAAGDQLKVTWVFTPAGVANDAVNNTGQNFRLAIADSPSANRLTVDGAPAAPTGGNYLGYAMFMNMDQTLRRSTPFSLMERTTGTGGFLSASADWASLIDAAGTGDPGYVSGTEYTYTMTLTRNASDGLDIVSTMTGALLGPGNQGFLTVSFTDTTPSTFTFDTFGIRPSAAATTATSFDTTLFQVESNVPIPEPTSLALLGLGGLTLLRRRRGA
jgi:hypothetical protein